MRFCKFTRAVSIPCHFHDNLPYLFPVAPALVCNITAGTVPLSLGRGKPLKSLNPVRPIRPRRLEQKRRGADLFDLSGVEAVAVETENKRWKTHSGSDQLASPTLIVRNSFRLMGQGVSISVLISKLPFEKRNKTKLPCLLSQHA